MSADTRPPQTYPVTVEWTDGRAETHQLPADTDLVSASESRGLGLPFGCRTGACATCVAQLVDGEVEHVRPPRGLKERHLGAGYVLCCVAQPRSACRLRVGSAVQRELVSNPWR
ncbi:2Fe-2S iron-sulfur cluster-binding protein [Haloarchaeobius sp. TZWWS8]|uniref:2Fe-2S iron-sulfur cluster-binding protein n=1 Tax=Haloarchaeobius sp. TZWWS8 TaxID=3446121 RepID=UPI003EBD0BE3